VRLTTTGIDQRGRRLLHTKATSAVSALEQGREKRPSRKESCPRPLEGGRGTRRTRKRKSRRERGEGSREVLLPDPAEGAGKRQGGSAVAPGRCLYGDGEDDDRKKKSRNLDQVLPPVRWKTTSGGMRRGGRKEKRDRKNTCQDQDPRTGGEAPSSRLAKWNQKSED